MRLLSNGKQTRMRIVELFLPKSSHIQSHRKKIEHPFMLAEYALLISLYRTTTKMYLCVDAAVISIVSKERHKFNNRQAGVSHLMSCQE